MTAPVLIVIAPIVEAARMPLLPLEETGEPAMVVTATLPPVLLMSMALPAPVLLVIGFGPVAEVTFKSTLNPPAPPEMVTPPVVTVWLLNWTSRLPVAVLLIAASEPVQTETPAVFPSQAARAGDAAAASNAVATMPTRTGRAPNRIRPPWTLRQFSTAVRG